MEQEKCNICNSLLYEDGTAENCTAECERQIHYVPDIHQPLDFNDEGHNVVRDLPEIEDIYDNYIEGEAEFLMEEEQ